MADSSKPTHEVAGATPPGRGEQTHETMRGDASRLVTGPASTPTLARERRHSRCRDASRTLTLVQRETLSHEPIPGERDPATLTAREPGAIGTFAGGELPRADARALLSEDDIEELRRDGGGLSRKHKR